MTFKKLVVTYLVIFSDPSYGDQVLDVLDSFTRVMTGKQYFSRYVYQDLVNAMHKFDPDILQSQNQGWRGVVEYYQTNGGPTDPWGGNPSKFRERNTTIYPLPNGQTLQFYEPCNGASNFAYYHMITGMAKKKRWSMRLQEVKGLAQTCAALCLGSAFYHGSHTRLGSMADNDLIGVMSFILHQASLSHLPAFYNSPVLSDLSSVKRNQTGVEMAQSITDLYRTRPITEWLEFFNQLDVPDYYTTWSALVTTLLTLFLPQSLISPAALALADAFGVDERSIQFLQRQYIPQVTRALSKYSLNPAKKIGLFKYFMKMIKKMVFAFLFQEQTFEIDFLTSPLANQIGAFLQHPVNAGSELLTIFEKGISGRLISGQGIYPGDVWCRKSQPHSLWHAQSAAALLDFFLLVDKLIGTVYL